MHPQLTLANVMLQLSSYDVVGLAGTVLGAVYQDILLWVFD
jgi:hypothetical protein